MTARTFGAGLAAAGLLLALAAPAGAEAIPPDEAQTRARAAVPKPQKREQIEALAYGRFDFDTISKLVLARNWSKLSEQQRTDFVKEFKRHLSLTYGNSFEGYTDESVQTLGTRMESNGDVTVRSQLVGGKAGEGVAIDYRLRPKDGEWYVIDVIIERVSLISNFRSQIQEIIAKNGADGLIGALRAKNAAREAQAGS